MVNFWVAGITRFGGNNTKHAILAKNIKNGFNFTGCNIFYAAVELVNCQGIKITSGTLACALTVTGDCFNQISGNYIVEARLKPCKIGKNTIARDNFTSTNTWIPPAQ